MRKQLPLFPDLQGTGESNVSPIRPDVVLALASNLTAAKPEYGRRTPQSTLRRYRRRSFSDLTLATVKSILDKARDQGDVQDLADLWNLMLHDAHLASVYESRRAPVFSARWEINPPDVSESKQALADRGAAGVAEALHGIDELPSALAALLDAIGLGWAACEIEWGHGTLLGQPAVIPRKLHPILPRRFGFSDTFEVGLYDDGQAVTLLKERGYEVEVIQGRGRSMARLPAGKYVVHQPIRVHDVKTATGLVFSLGKWWWAAQVGWQAMLTGAESYAMPRFVAMVEQATPGAIMDEALEGLENLAVDGMAVLKGGTRIELLEPDGQGGVNTWTNLIKMLYASMSKAVLGSTLNVEIDSSGGNRAAAESQGDRTMDPRHEQDGQQLWSTLRRDLFRYIVAFNPHIFPAGTPLPIGRSVLAEEPVEIDELLVRAKAVSNDELRESRGLPPEGGEWGAAKATIVEPGNVATPYGMSQEAPEVAATDDPFALTAREMSRVWTSTAATETSTPLQTTSARKPSES